MRVQGGTAAAPARRRPPSLLSRAPPPTLRSSPQAFWDLDKEVLARHEAEALKFDPDKGDLFHSMQLMLNGMYALRNLGWHVLAPLTQHRADMWRWLEQLLALDPKRLHAMWKNSPTLFSRPYLKLSYLFVMFMLFFTIVANVAFGVFFHWSPPRWLRRCAPVPLK